MGSMGLAKKRTRVFTNSPIIDRLLDKQCSRDHEHVHLMNGRAAKAAAYPTAMCDAFLDGILMETEQRDSALFAMDGMCEDAEAEGLIGIDDVSGEELDPKKVIAARQEEMEGFGKQEVYDYVPREQAANDPDGKFIGVRWVDTNKGTKEEQKVRSRLVGQEYATGPRQDELYAPTPPLAAARLMLSMCASRGKGGPGDWITLLLNVKKAFLYSRISRTVYIELPSEDPRSEGGEW